jgi:hypothetical protein
MDKQARNITTNRYQEITENIITKNNSFPCYSTSSIDKKVIPNFLEQFINTHNVQVAGSLYYSTKLPFLIMFRVAADLSNWIFR